MCLQHLIFQLYVNLGCYVLVEVLDSQIFIATWKKWEVFTWPVTSQMWTTHPTLAKVPFCIFCCGWSEKLEMVFYEPLSIKKRLMSETVWTENNPVLFMFHLQGIKKKKKAKEKSEKVPVLQDEWRAEFPH